MPPRAVGVATGGARSSARRRASEANASQVSNVPPALRVDDTLRRDEATADLLYTAGKRHAGDLRASLAGTSRPPCRRRASTECPRRLRPGRARVRRPSCADSRPHAPDVCARAPKSYTTARATSVSAGDGEWGVARLRLVATSSHRPQSRMTHATRQPWGRSSTSYDSVVLHTIAFDIAP
jgi:hypothetical protein